MYKNKVFTAIEQYKLSITVASNLTPGISKEAIAGVIAEEYNDRNFIIDGPFSGMMI
jgi:hypothetical protein